MKDYLKILGFVLLAEILTLFLNLTLAFSASVVFRCITSICTLGILTGLMAQAGYAIAKSDRKLLKENPNAVRPSKPIMLGMAAIFPFQFCWILLALAKFGVLDSSFYRIYKLLCAPFLQICNLICDDVTAQALPLWGLIVLALLTIVPYAAVVIAYQMTMRGEHMENMIYQ